MTNADQTLDTKGMTCPMPVLKTKKTMKGMDVGKILEVIASDPGSVNDIPAWCRTTGQELLNQEQKGEIYHFLIKKLK